MFGWKRDRDHQDKLDMEIAPWNLAKEELPPRSLDPRVDMTLAGARPPSVARRLADIAGPAPRCGGPEPGGDDSKRLVVGRDIVLTGEIKACERLVVEGRVEAALSDIRAVEIAPSGMLKGAAHVDTADIAGSYEGDLTVQQKLRIRATGRVQGQIRYGSIEIERGGKIGGQVEALANDGVIGSAPEILPPRAQVGADEMKDVG